MTHDELRKLAEAARDAKLADKHHQGLLESSTTQAIWADFYTAANPKTVLELLDRIAELEGAEKRRYEDVAGGGP